MNFFRREKRKNNILKVYKTVTQEQAEQFDTKSLIDFQLEELRKLNLKPTHFYITGPYPSKGWQSENSFLKAVKNKEYRNIHHLIINVENVLYVSFGNWAHNFTIPLDFYTIECDLMLNSDKVSQEWLKEYSFKLHNVLAFDYGYIFDQPINYSINEGKIVNGLFSTTEKENKDYKRWARYQYAIKDGYIRKLYKFNFISDKAIQKSPLTDLIINRRLGTIKKKDEIILWTLNDEELMIARQLTRESDIVVENEQFNETESKKDVDNNLWNRIRPTASNIKNHRRF
jgi:hypothetical protein